MVITEPLVVVVKPLFVECLMAALGMDPWVGGKMLALVVNQVCLSESQERAAAVVTICPTSEVEI